MDLRKFLPLVLVLLGLLAYINILPAPFIFDDEPNIQNDETIRDLSQWPHILASGGRRPLVKLTLAVNYAIDQLNPVGYHLVNIAVHILAGLTLYGLVRRTLGLPHWRERFEKSATWLAFVAALWWLLHPLNTQAVAYTIQRSEAMMGLFFLLTLYAIVRGSESGRRTWYAAAVVFCALGMACKEVMAAAPLVAILYDRCLLTRSWKETLRRRWLLYLCLAGTWGLFGLMGMSEITAAQASAGFAIQALTPMQYALTQPGVILHYLRLSVWPYPQALDYGWPLARTFWQIVPPLVILTALGLATLWALWKKPAIGFLGASFFLILAPTSSIMPIADLAFEHRMYLPLTAVVVFIVMGGWQLLQWLSAKTPSMASRPAMVGSLVAVVVTAGLGARTVWRNHDYRSDVAIWESVVRVRPYNARAYNNLGSALDKADRPREALDNYIKAVALAPHYAEAHNNLGALWLDMGQTQQGYERLQVALGLAPHDPEINYNVGKAHLTMRNWPEAEKYFRRALELKPRYPKALNNLGLVLIQQGRAQEAQQALQKAIAIEPDFADAYNNLGHLLLQKGSDPQTVRQAIAYFERAVELQPQQPAFLNNLGQALATGGDYARATSLFLGAIQANPSYAEAYQNLGSALLLQGQARPAVDAYRRALALRPGWADVMRKLAWVLATHPDPSVRSGQEALRLAQAANQATGGQQPLFLDTLAAAYAETGQFDQAIAAARQGLAIAQEAGAAELAKKLSEHLARLEQKQPLRDALR